MKVIYHIRKQQHTCKRDSIQKQLDLIEVLEAHDLKYRVEVVQ